MILLLDESVDGSITELLRTEKFKLVSIAASYKGMKDEMIIEFAKEDDWLLITEDKDFSDLVFAKGHKNVSIIFLRYRFYELESIKITLLRFLQQRLGLLQFTFSTLTPKKVRTRKIE